MDEITITIDGFDECTAEPDPNTPGFVALDMVVLITAKREWLDGDAKPEVVETGVGAQVELFRGTAISILTYVIEHDDFPMPDWLVSHPALLAAIMEAAPAKEEAENERALAAHEARHG